MAIDIEQIFKDLNKATEKDTKRISEGAFKTLFLPMFLDQKNNPHELVMAHWIEFSGSPFKSVHVVDAQDNVLFTVPPIYNRKALDDLTNKDDKGRSISPISHILTTYAQMSKIGPQVGENYINGELGQRFQLMRQDVDYIESLRVWKEIFERYGHGNVIPLNIGTGNKTKQMGNDNDHVEVIDL